jgi:MFS family permease
VSSGTLDRLGLPALGYGPFRIFFASNLFANTGIFLFMAAFGWFVQAETGSAAMVGLASAIMGMPWLVLMLHAGMLTDRLGARRLIAWSFVGGGIGMAAVALVALMPQPNLAVVLAVVLGMGVLMTLGAPGTVSIVPELVPPAAVSSAVGLNFLLINIARIVGGVSAGLLLGGGREPGFTILLGALLFGLPGLAIWRLPTKEPDRRVRTVSGGAMLGPILEAARHATRFPTLGVILLLSAGPGLIGLPYTFLLPVAAQELGIGAEGLGLLLGAIGTGGLVSGLLNEHLQRWLGQGRSILVGLAASAGGLIVFGLGLPLPITMVAVGFVGAGFVIYASSSLTLVQALAPPALRGRLTSVFSLLYWGLMPIGGLLGGLVAQAFSARTAFLGAGIGLVALGVIASIVRPQVRTLGVSRDGLQMRGDLSGTGVARDGILAETPEHSEDDVVPGSPGVLEAPIVPEHVHAASAAGEAATRR